jgi:hypothetical protein
MFLQLALSFGSDSITSSNLDGLLLMGLKATFILGVLIYLVFAIIIVRQIHVMKKTLITPFSPIVQTIGYTHLAVVLFVGALFLLIL